MGGVFNGQNAHHVIPCELYNGPKGNTNLRHPLLNAAGDVFDINGAYNGRPLWIKAFSVNALKAMETYHGPNSKYGEIARDLMTDSWLNLINTGGYNNSILATVALLGVIADLNQLISGVGMMSSLANTLGLASGPCNLGGDFL